MGNIENKNEKEHNKKLLGKQKKKKSTLSSIKKLIFLFSILLLILLIMGKGVGFYKYRDGSNTATFNEGQSAKGNNTFKEEFTEIMVKEDKIYLNQKLISVKDLELYLSTLSDNLKIKLIDDRAINKVFNQVKSILEEGKFAYMIES